MRTIFFYFISSILFTTSIYAQSVHQFTMNDIEGNPVELSKYKGKVLLIVNTASKCGLTPQYEGLQATYDKYKDEGLVILGFPANNFMGQEPGSDEKIKEFCTKKFDVTFPMFSKISVKGKNIDPLYTFLTTKKENGKVDAPVAWNFQKFLINKEGKVVQSISPGKKVTETAIINAIERQLKK